MSVFKGSRRVQVRKNVTMDARVVESLEKLSALSGVPQGAIIERALGAWPTRALMALATSASPVADVLEIYLSVHPRVEEDVVIAFCGVLGDVLASTRFKGGVVNMTCEGRDGVVTNVEYCHEAANAYVAGHLGAAGFGNVRDLAVVNAFVVPDDEVTRRNVAQFLNALRCVASLDGFVDEGAMRVLVVLFRDFAYPVEEGDRAALYEAMVSRGAALGL